MYCDSCTYLLPFLSPFPVIVTVPFPVRCMYTCLKTDLGVLPYFFSAPSWCFSLFLPNFFLSVSRFFFLCTTHFSLSPLSGAMSTTATGNPAASPSRSKREGKSAGRFSLLGHLYLCLYNSAALGAWAYVFYLFLQHCLEKRSWMAGGGAPALYRRLEWPLIIAQSMQIMEILHAMIGLVRSGVVTTFIQVEFSKKTALSTS